MKFHYRAVDKAGQPVSDIFEGTDALDAADKLRRQGLFVISIEQTAGDEVHQTIAGKRVGTGRRLKNTTQFARQLHVLISTGTPLVQALGALERQVTDKLWLHVVASLRNKVEEGLSLSAAMGEFPHHFDSVTRSLIAAGESSGNFEVMLDRVATLSRKQLHVRSSIIGAMIYPALLIVVAVGVLTLLLTFVLPRFAELFKTLDTALPPTTQALMWVSHILRSYWYIIIAAIIACGFAIKHWLASPTGKQTIDRTLLRLPQFGKITQSFCTARVTRVLGTLLESKVPMLEAIHLTRGACKNSEYAKLLVHAEDAVTRGEPISSAFSNPRLINPSVCEAVRNGERSGQVGKLLLNISEFLDEENEVIVRSLTSILEPIILIVLGILVGIVAISMFLPLFDLTAAAGGGG